MNKLPTTIAAISPSDKLSHSESKYYVNVWAIYQIRNKNRGLLYNLDKYNNCKLPVTSIVRVYECPTTSVAVKYSIV